MNLKISTISLAVLCVLSSSRGSENTTQDNYNETSKEMLESTSNELDDFSSKDLDKEPSLWRLWRPFRELAPCKFAHANHIRMFYIDSQLTKTRRDSSLVIDREENAETENVLENIVVLPSPTPNTNTNTLGGRFSSRTYKMPSTDNSLTSTAVVSRKLPVQTEIVTLMFESMLEHIVDSWEVIQSKTEEKNDAPELVVVADTIKKKKTAMSGKISKTKRASHKSENDVSMTTTAEITTKVDPMLISWWSAPDEKAIIHFKNGNKYVGNISMKCMHGEGRFQWADGTVYLGQFDNNNICGKGTIYWKDDSWYEGEFFNNLRHGKGLYVDSRNQRCYSGGWYCGTKHGEGVIYYDNTFKDSYDGEWFENERTGFGLREYSDTSGFRGEWQRNVIQGNGLMIWPNGDFYSGEWKNGTMSGEGLYIWDAYCNNSMSLPDTKSYRGQWQKGQRHGFGHLTLGLGVGAFFKGEFRHNKKHGSGKFVTASGLIIQDKNLFIDDNIRSATENMDAENKSPLLPKSMEPCYKFELCDKTVGLLYHIGQALENMDKEQEHRRIIVNDYLIRNKCKSLQAITKRAPAAKKMAHESLEEFVKFEESSLFKALKCYETDLNNIYNQYATMCNTQEIQFKPVLIRMYLWQLYFDCNIHGKGLTLVQIDDIYHKNPEWMSLSPHDPFEKIYFWQFIHSLISVARILYAKKEFPEKKPDTILADAFRTFMKCDILPGSATYKGYFANGYGLIIPLQATYAIYRRLGEPHTIRTFLCAVKRPIHYFDRPQPPLVETSEKCIPLGRNVYLFGEEMDFVTDNDDIELLEENTYADVKLFNIANLSSKSIISIFAKIFPQAYNSNKIIDLEIQITFFEFFEALLCCAEESITIKIADCNDALSESSNPRRRQGKH